MAEDDDQSALEPKGMVAAEILVPDDHIAGDADLVASVVDFVNWAMERAHLVFGEIAPEAFWCYHADYYLAQVNNGGHGQFARNSAMSPKTIDNCRHGLVAMGAADYAQIFDDFLAIMNGDPARAKTIREGGGFGDIDPAIRELDKRFHALRTMTALNAAWLRGLPNLRPLPADRLNAERDAVTARNSMRAAREDYLRRARERFAATDPLQVAARATCGQEGITFEGVNAGLPFSGGISWGLRTSAGLRMLAVTDTAAVLRADGALRGQYFYATKTEYPAPAGDGALRRTLLTTSGQDVQSRIKAATRQTHAASQPASPERLLANFLAHALIAFWGAFTSRSPLINAAIICPYIPGYAPRVSFVPRAASPLLAMSEEHALQRLIIANALWDSLAASDALKDSVLQHPDTAGALLANLGAAATVAATSLRLLDGQRIEALSLLAPDEFAREQYNVRFQLLEIGRWWFSFVPAAIAAFSKMEFPRGSWFFTNACGHHAKLLDQQLCPMAMQGLTDALGYFDREYQALPASQMPSPYHKAVTEFVDRFGASKARTEAWVTMFATLRRAIANAKPFGDTTILVVPPDIPGVRTPEKLVGMATVMDGAAHVRQAFVFSKDGARDPLGA